MRTGLGISENILEVLAILTNPNRFVRQILKTSGWGSFRTRLDYDAIAYPNYAYCTYYAALQAKALGIDGISVLEFGVAGGSGLVALERIATEVEEAVGITIDVYGFDSGRGMPEASDWRDLPYVWQKGFFEMDEQLLKSKLKKARLVIGPVSQTVTAFIDGMKPKPIGFIAFDLDYYTSTMDAFALLEAGQKWFLPRTYCYFDDCIGNDWELHGDFTGELLAISDFNRSHEIRKLSRVNGLRYKRKIEMRWNDLVYIFHIFNHRLYCKHIYPDKDWQLPL